jgi:hypothetical protein
MYPRSLIKLYRDIRVAHRLLPTEHRSLGDAYVRSEFRQHRSSDAYTSDEKRQAFLTQFERQWRDYMQQLRTQLKQGELPGRALTKKELAGLSAEQRINLSRVVDAPKG